MNRPGFIAGLGSAAAGDDLGGEPERGHQGSD
jgi:hypothetical protein